MQWCWLAPAKSPSSLGCCMTIGAAVAANSLNLPAGRSCAPSGVTVETLTVWGYIPFLHNPEECRSRGAQCKVVCRTFCGVWTPGISLIPALLCNPALCFHLFPVCFLPGAEAAECVRPWPQRSWVNMSFCGICHDFLAQKPSLFPCISWLARACRTEHCSLGDTGVCSRLLLYFCVVSVLILLILQISQDGFSPLPEIESS